MSSSSDRLRAPKGWVNLNRTIGGLRLYNHPERGKYGLLEPAPGGGSTGSMRTFDTLSDAREWTNRAARETPVTIMRKESNHQAHSEQIMVTDAYFDEMQRSWVDVNLSPSGGRRQYKDQEVYEYSSELKAEWERLIATTRAAYLAFDAARRVVEVFEQKTLPHPKH